MDGAWTKMTVGDLRKRLRAPKRSFPGADRWLMVTIALRLWDRRGDAPGALSVVSQVSRSEFLRSLAGINASTPITCCLYDDGRTMIAADIAGG